MEGLPWDVIIENASLGVLVILLIVLVKALVDVIVKQSERTEKFVEALTVAIQAVNSANDAIKVVCATTQDTNSAVKLLPLKMEQNKELLEDLRTMLERRG